MAHIPDEIFLHLLLFIYDDEKTWAQCRLVNKQLNEIVSNYRYHTVTLTENNLQVKHTLFQGAPGEFYLEVDPHTNYSKYKVPQRFLNQMHNSTLIQDVTTIWKRVRIDPNTLLLNTGDFTFSTSTGYFNHHNGHEHHVPYGSCFDCEYRLSKSGTAMIDLRGTPFAVKSGFYHDGCFSNGDWRFEHKNQVVKLTGGGHCGWTCPLLAKDETQAAAGGWLIELQLVESKDSCECL